MQASAYLAAALVFAIPTSALTNPPSETLLALNTVQTFGLVGSEFGRFFDAAGHHAYLSRPEISSTNGTLGAAWGGVFGSGFGRERTRSGLPEISGLLR